MIWVKPFATKIFYKSERNDILNIVLASHNKNKLSEISQNLKPLNVKVKSLEDFKLEPPTENGKDFKENSFIKAMYAFEKTGLPSLGDDSGFCVDSLNDFPGLCSARFAQAVGSYEKAFDVLNQCINPENKKVHFMTSMTFVYVKNSKVIAKHFEGRVNGLFSYPAKGKNGFGYCPIFIPDGYSCTYAELSNDVRTKINHRYKAFEKFVDFFKSELLNIWIVTLLNKTNS